MSMATQPGSFTSESHNLVASDRVEGTAVRQVDGKKIGSVKRMMIDKVSGQVAYAVVQRGGFLGVGGEFCAVPWRALKFDQNLSAYELTLSEDELRAAPSSENSEEFDWGVRVPKHYSDSRFPQTWA